MYWRWSRIRSNNRKRITMKKLLFVALPVFVLSLLFSCKREQTVWDSNWQLPLLSDSLTLTNLVDDSILTVVGGNYQLSIDRELLSMKLSDFVEIPDTTINHAFAMTLNGISIPPGTSFVNDIQEHDLHLGEIELKKIVVKSGGIKINVLNPIATKTNFTVELPGVTKNGATLSQFFAAPAGTNSQPGQVDGFVDLSGYTVDLRGADLGGFNLIQSRLIVQSDPSGQSVILSNQDSMRFVFELADIQIDYARGYFGSQLISETIDKNSALLASIQSGLIDIDAASLGIRIENGLKLSAKFRLNEFKNTNHQAQTVSLSHSTIGNWQTINAATGTYTSHTPSVYNMLVDGTNSNLEQFIENHGGTIGVKYDLHINPWGNISGGWDEIWDKYPLSVQITGDLPLNMQMDNFLIQDTFALSIKNDPTKTHIKAGKIWMNATNAFPLQGAVVLQLLDNNNNLITTLTGSSIVASSLTGNLVNGLYQKDSYIVFDFPESIVDLVGTTSKCVVKLVLNTPNATQSSNTKVSIPENAFFKFKVGTKITLENRL